MTVAAGMSTAADSSDDACWRNFNIKETSVRIRRLIGLGLMVTGIATTALAQARPDFSGRWTLETSVPSGVTTEFPSLIVKQNAATLTAGQVEGGHHTSTYRLDGREHEVAIGPTKSVSKATWDGQTLVIDRTDTLPTGRSRTFKYQWSLDDAGKLTIKSTEILESSGPRTVTNVYVKK